MSKKPSVKPASAGHKADAEKPVLSNKVLIPAIILFFIVLAYMYCQPLLEGMQLSTHDSNQYIAMNKESADYKAATGDAAMWSSRMFGGMPAFMIGGLEFSPALNMMPLMLIHKVLRVIPDPAMDIVFLLICGFIGFYVLTRKVLLSLLGAVAIGFCTANFVSLDAGHITKVNTIAMFLPLFASVWLTFQKKYYTGIILFLIFSFEIITQRHVQIAYYSFMLIGLYGVYEIARNILQKDIKNALIAPLLLAGALAISVMMNFDNFFINDFSKETTRGGDILNAAKMGGKSAEDAASENEKGVGFDYATNWSFGFEEIGSWLVPNFVGGSSAAGLDENSAVYKTLTGKGVPAEQAGQFVQRMPLYWGSEPFVQGPIYFGAIVIFLFVFGLFAYKGPLKGWLVGGIVFSVLIALGKNFEVFYRLLYDIVPMFNKFRAPTMILALTQILMVTLGVLGLKDFFDEKTSQADRMKSVKFSAGIVGGLLVAFILLGSAMSLRSKAIGGDGQSTDQQFVGQLTQMTGDANFANEIYNSLLSDRSSMLRADALRSITFVAIVVALLFLLASGKFRKPSYVLAGIALLVLIDFWPVNKRYLNADDFEEKSMVEMNAFPQTPADAAILAANKDGARMIDFTGDVFNSASPAYFHRTVGGYNPAKLRRYQDVIEYGLSYDFQLLNQSGFTKTNFLNMLNTKYIKQSQEASGVMQNPFALGNAWFVRELQTVATPEEEMLKVRDINPAQTAIVHQEFERYMAGFSPNTDSAANTAARFIQWVDTKNPMKLEYTFKSDKPEFVVFSEVIYRPNQDWISYIDGKPADHIRVNYILRGMKVDAGEHTITFEFKPRLYAMTNNVLLLGNILFYLAIAVLAFLWYRDRKSSQTAA